MNWIKIFEYTANYIILPSPLFTPTRHPKLIRRVPHSSHQSRRRMVQPLPTAAAPRERLPSVRAVPRARRPRGFPYPREGPRLRRKLRRAACGGGWRGGGGRGCCRERTRGAPPARAGRGPQSLSARGPHVSAPLPHASHRLPPREARTFTPTRLGRAGPGQGRAQTSARLPRLRLVCPCLDAGRPVASLTGGPRVVRREGPGVGHVTARACRARDRMAVPGTSRAARARVRQE